MNDQLLSQISPGDVAKVLKLLWRHCEQNHWLRMTSLNYVYTAITQLERLQERMEQVTVSTVSPDGKVAEPDVAAPHRSEADEILKRLLQS